MINAELIHKKVDLLIAIDQWELHASHSMSPQGSLLLTFINSL